MPHAKTHKSSDVLRLQMAAGFRSFKCATLREAEMVAENGVGEIIIAYPLLHPKKLERLVSLMRRHPESEVKVIVSTPEPGVAIMDAGQKAIGADTGMPRIDNPPGVEVKPMSAEHGSLVVREGSVALGDKVWVVPWDVGHTANLHDYMQVVRDGRLEAVWEVSARGRFR